MSVTGETTLDGERLDAAADAVARAEVLVLAAGAGMGVDSGLPDFRGAEGFWNAYPPYRALGLDFADLANPAWFRRDPAFAWGFYGHRLALYRRTVPHAGFRILRRIGERAPGGAFVFTSNVDGQFARAGFAPEQLCECHGAIEHLQCLAECGVGIFPAPLEEVAVDPETFRASPPFPRCPRCDSLARPNILMFDDGHWDGRRYRQQHTRLTEFLRAASGRRVVVVECGAGVAIPSVRWFSERTASATSGRLVRINVRDPEVPPGQVGIAAGALAALVALEARL